MPTLTVKITNPKMLELINEMASIGTHLRQKSRFKLTPQGQDFVDRTVAFYGDIGAVSLPAGSKFFRARTHGVGQSNAYPASDMGAPPMGMAASGRINPEGISNLYVADQPATAIAEVRPWADAAVSVATIELTTGCRIVDVGAQGARHKVADPIKSLVDAWFSQGMVRQYFSAPAHRDDRLAYLASQYIAEAFKEKGFDGIKYPSVLNPDGYNIALYDPTRGNVSSVGVYQVKKVTYEAVAV